MRKILLIALLTIAVCSSALAIDWFWKKTPSDLADLKNIQNALASLTPTEAETKAISNLRQKLFSPDDYGGGNGGLPVKISTEAAPIDDDDVRISIEYRFISGKEPLISKITAIPALTWTGLPVNSKQFADTGLMSGTFSSSVGIQMPMLVRYLEQTNVQKFSDQMHVSRMVSCLVAPKITVAKGQENMTADTTTIPFVTGVVPVEQEGEMCYQPVIQMFDQGMILTTKATLLQDGSCRLEKCQLVLTNLVKIDEVKLVDGDLSNAEFDKTKERSGVTIQVPTVQSFRADIPEIVIPQGMTLLVAFPGAGYPPHGLEDNDRYGMFLLITPQAMRHGEQMTDTSAYVR